MVSVIIVDDSLFVRNSIKQMLKPTNITIVAEADDGISAVEKYKSLRPDLVLMDIMMPNMNGIEAMKKIKEFDPKCKIIVISSLHQEHIIKEAKQMGALDFIIKPFEIGAILHVIEDIFES